jgi:non-canonical (house-cleaning) NTP pyrophosphatase
VEGGCEIQEGELVAFAWIVLLSEDRMSQGRTAAFRLPPEVQKLVEGGMELGDADDQIFGESNSKQQNGAVGLLTENTVTRTTLYEQAVIMALILRTQNSIDHWKKNDPPGICQRGFFVFKSSSMGKVSNLTSGGAGAEAGRR